MSISDLMDDDDDDDEREKFLDQFDPDEDAELIRDLISVAHHEAGHGAVAMSFGIPVHLVIGDVRYCRRSDGHTLGYGVKGWCAWGDTPPPHDQRRLICLAGAVQQLRHEGVPLVEGEVLRRMSRSDVDGAGGAWTEADIAWVVAILSWWGGWIDDAVESLLDEGEFSDAPSVSSTGSGGQ